MDVAAAVAHRVVAAAGADVVALVGLVAVLWMAGLPAFGVLAVAGVQSKCTCYSIFDIHFSLSPTLLIQSIYINCMHFFLY